MPEFLSLWTRLYYKRNPAQVSVSRRGKYSKSILAVAALILNGGALDCTAVKESDLQTYQSIFSCVSTLWFNDTICITRSPDSLWIKCCARQNSPPPSGGSNWLFFNAGGALASFNKELWFLKKKKLGNRRGTKQREVANQACNLISCVDEFFQQRRHRALLLPDAHVLPQTNCSPRPRESHFFSLFIFGLRDVGNKKETRNRKKYIKVEREDNLTLVLEQEKNQKLKRRRW